jgi:hypothetical protein
MIVALLIMIAATTGTGMARDFVDDHALTAT